MKILTRAFIFCVSVLLAHTIPCQADLIITYDLTGADGVGLNGQASGSVTKNNVTASFSAGPSGSTFGRSGSPVNFGINSPGDGDQTNQFDASNESATISFNKQVTFRQVALDVQDLSGNATIQFGSDAAQTLTFNSSGPATFNFSRVLSVGENVILTFGSGAFSFESFTIAIPEPSVGLLALVAAAGFGIARLRRRKCESVSANQPSLEVAG